MFAYCLNNPVNFVDYTGMLAYPGEIHNEVVRRIKAKYGYYSEQIILYDLSDVKNWFKKGFWGRADLISPDGQVWDVKRDKASQIKAGQAQVARYVENIWKGHNDVDLKVGGDDITSDAFYYKSGLNTYRVTYRNAGNGVIAYDYRKVEFDSQTLNNAVRVAGAAVCTVVAFGLLDSYLSRGQFL